MEIEVGDAMAERLFIILKKDDLFILNIFINLFHNHHKKKIY